MRIDGDEGGLERNERKRIKMKILGLLLQHFGKFQNRKIRLEDGINVIYGENESGKSTIHAFIKGMLFGIERGRGRASLHDTYSIYEPWEGPGQYKGVLRFESGGKVFRIDRNFDRQQKKAELICEDDGEELSIAEGDLDLLLGGLTPAGYDNTISIGQLKARPDQSLAAALKEYATSCYASGNGDLRPEQAIRYLQEQKKAVEKEMREALYEKQRERESVEQEASYIWREIHRLTEEEQTLEDRLSQAERKEPGPEEHKRLVDEIRPAKWRIHPVEILIFAAAIIAAFFLFPRPINYLIVIVIFLACSVYVWNRLKVGKRKNQSLTEEFPEELLLEEEMSEERLRWELERIGREKKDKQIQYDNLQEQLAEMQTSGKAERALEKRNQALQTAILRMNELSEVFRKRLEQRLNEEASKIVCQITGGAYTKIRVEEGLHMVLLKEGDETSPGLRRIPMEQVSCGTVEQICFALRMAAAGILQEEEQPVILDDAFGNYDEERLKHTLKWLAGQKKQVLIFTCQKREIRLLQELGIPCNVAEI